MTDPTTYTRTEVAQRLGMPREAVRQLALQGRLGARWDERTRTWRFERAAVDAALQARDAQRQRQAPRVASAAILLADADVTRCARWRARLLASGIAAPIVAAYDPATMLVSLERVRPRVALIGRMTYFDSPQRLVDWLRSAQEFAGIEFVLAGDAAGADEEGRVLEQAAARAA